MIHPEPELRLEIADILASEYMKEGIATEDEVNQEMTRRKEVSERMARQARANAQAKAKGSSTRRDVGLNGVKYVVEF